MLCKKLIHTLLIVGSVWLLFATTALATSTVHPQTQWMSLRSNEVNMRVGPGLGYPVAWVYRRQGWPVRVIDVFENWRRVEDRDGTRGWIHRSVLTGQRTLVVTETMRLLRRRPDPAGLVVARLERGVTAILDHCNTDGWCRIEAGGYKGWLENTSFWPDYTPDP